MKSTRTAHGVIYCVLAFALAACSSGGGTNVGAPLGVAPSGGTQACPGIRIGQAQCDVLIGNQGAQPNSVAGLTAADLENAYNLPSTSKGKGYGGVFIVDAYDNPNVASDLAEYRSVMGLPKAKFNKYNQEGDKSGYPSGSEGWGVEIDLDTQMVSASCPNCTVNLIEANSSNWSDLEAAENEAVKLGGNIITNSYSGTGGTSSSFGDKGVEYLASAGDGGTGIEEPAGYDSVVAVGGTDLVKSSTNKRGWTETIWAESGGGCETGEKKPPWQLHNKYAKNCSGRQANDVSAVADIEVAEYDTYGEGGWFQVGGTSVSSPLCAGIFALAGNATKQDGGRTFWQAKHHKYLYVVDERYTAQGGWGSPDGIGAF
jgi:subtilase family serine protease